MPIAFLLAMLLAGAVMSGTQRHVQAQAAGEDASLALAEAMLTLINETRLEAGLAPYRNNPILTGTALGHAREIAAHNHFSHTGLDGRRVKDRALDAGYGAGRTGIRIGENYVNRKNVGDAFRWLMDDPPHRANMMHAQYRDAGVGVARTAYGYVWVIDFGMYAGIAAETAIPAPNAAASDPGKETATGQQVPADALLAASTALPTNEPVVAPTNETSFELLATSTPQATSAPLTLPSPEPTTVPPTLEPSPTPTNPEPTATIPPVATITPTAEAVVPAVPWPGPNGASGSPSDPATPTGSSFPASIVLVAPVIALVVAARRDVRRRRSRAKRRRR